MRLPPEERPDTMIAQMPGLQADRVATALALEGIVCLLECEGVRQLRAPGRESAEPLAVTLPVSIYVPGGRRAEVEEILESLKRDDLIGEQWGEAVAEQEPAAHKGADDGYGDGAEETSPASAAELMSANAPPPPRTEGTALRLLLTLALGGLLILLMLRS